MGCGLKRVGTNQKRLKRWDVGALLLIKCHPVHAEVIFWLGECCSATGY